MFRRVTITDPPATSPLLICSVVITTLGPFVASSVSALLCLGKTFASLQTGVISAQAAFFSHARTLRKALEVDAPETLLRNFASGTTEARATLHLSRAAAALGHRDLARKLVERGLDLARDTATILKSELQEVQKSLGG